MIVRWSASLLSTVIVLCGAAGCASGNLARASGSRPPTGSPGCSMAAQTGPDLSASATATTDLVPPPRDGAPPGPFGVAVAAAGNWGFTTGLPISATTSRTVESGSTPPPSPLPRSGQGAESGVDVLRLAPGQAPELAHVIKVPGPTAGAAFSADGRLLLVAGGAGDATVISVEAAEHGTRHAVLGSLVRPGGSTSDGAIEVAVTPDGRFAFVSLEDAAEIAVFDLARAMAAGFRAGSGYIGTIPTGIAPVGLAVSPDGDWLYATSEAQSQGSNLGTVSVISVARAESDPAESVRATVVAGCSPVRVLTSADGSVVWVAARGSDALLAFSAAGLQARPSRALLADVRVGKAPVGLALARGGTLIVAADSDRFAPGFPVSNLAVVNVADALAGRPALAGYLPAGRFPRDIAASANGDMLIVANDASGQVEEVNAAALP
jgi:DNA-binding beta-propeller fold protein YncE